MNYISIRPPYDFLKKKKKRTIKKKNEKEEYACNAGDVGSTPGLGRYPGGHGNPLQYSYLGNPMDRGAWRAIVHGVKRVGHNFTTKPPELNK